MKIKPIESENLIFLTSQILSNTVGIHHPPVIVVSHNEKYYLDAIKKTDKKFKKSATENLKKFAFVKAKAFMRNVYFSLNEYKKNKKIVIRNEMKKEGEEDKMRTKITIEQIIKEISDLYNETYLQAEVDTIDKVVEVRNFFDATQTPYTTKLKYVTMKDEDVDDTCTPFDDIVAPVGSNIWNTITPPNHYNCRCKLVQVPDSTPTNNRSINSKIIPELFRRNPALDGIIFTTKHPYYGNK